MSDQQQDEAHQDRHKFHQHDADLEADDGTDELVSLEEAYADVVSPEEYVMSSQEAMDSAVEQQKLLDDERTR